MRALYVAGAALAVVAFLAPGAAAAGPETLFQGGYQFADGVARFNPGATFVLGIAPRRHRPTMVSPPVRPRLTVRFTGQGQAAQSPPLATDRNDPGALAGSTPGETDPAPHSCQLPPVLFQRGSLWVSPRQQRQLIAALKECAARRVTVTGYTCDLGSQAVNDRLARGRAAVVANLLQQAGFAVASTGGLGKSRYVGDNPAHRAQNRRVEVALTQP